jgi:hypothetical protein
MLKVPKEEVKAIVPLDDAPLHPNIDRLCNWDGRISCLALPGDSTSLIQPMDQGVIFACKRLYKKKFLNEVMVVIKTSDNVEEDRKG